MTIIISDYWLRPWHKQHVNFWQHLFLQFKQTSNVPISSKTCKFKMWIQDVHLFMHNCEMKSSRTISRTKTMNVECFHLLNNQTSGIILFGEWKEEQTLRLQQISMFYTTCRLMNNSLWMDPWLWQYRYVQFLRTRSGTFNIYIKYKTHSHNYTIKTLSLSMYEPFFIGSSFLPFLWEEKLTKFLFSGFRIFIHNVIIIAVFSNWMSNARINGKNFHCANSPIIF
jgi:hypothetical protein